MRKFSFERLPLVNPFSFFSLVIRVVSVRINHSRKLMDQWLDSGPQGHSNPCSGGYTPPSTTQMKSPENLVVFVDVFSLSKGKKSSGSMRSVFHVQESISLSTSSTVLHFCVWKPEVFFVTLPKTKNSPLKMDGWNTIVSFWDGLFSGAMLVSGRGNPSWN